jgi:RNA polymerase sigma factor (sigma-70 family)
MRPETDGQLLADYAARGDGAAFAELAARHAPMVHRVALRLLADAHEAEDAAQAVFVVLTRKAGALRDGAALAAWLHGVARRVAGEMLRERQRRARREEEAAMLRAREARRAAGEAGRRAVLESLDREVAALPEALRQAVILRYLEGRSQEESARILGCPQGTLARRASEGLERLRARLARGGAVMGGAALAGILEAEADSAMPQAVLASGAGAAVLKIAEGAMKAMFWAKVKLVAAVLSAAVALGGGGAVAVKLAAGEPAPAKEEPKVERKGPLAELPSAPGPHLEKLKALGDDAWLNLGAPAADPQWGRALGRSWTPKMAYAPDLRGAFLIGEGNHGWVNPKTRRQMDDLWFYDANAHRWVCAYPGTDTANLESAYTINADGFTATKDGRAVPTTEWVHGYECVTYDSDRKQFAAMSQAAGYGPAGALFKRSKRPGGPWCYDPAVGLWDRRPLEGANPTYLTSPTYGDVFMYVPSQKQFFYHAFGFSRNHSYFYDPATRHWTEVKTPWTGGDPKVDPKPPSGGDVVACYDARRDRIYMGHGQRLWFYDVKANSWVEPKPDGEFNAMDTHDVTMNYDAAGDRVVAVCLGRSGKPEVPRKVFVHDPETGRSAATAGTVPKEIGQLNGFYDPVLNAHFIHAAHDNSEGVMWAYRYKRAAK